MKFIGGIAIVMMVLFTGVMGLDSTVPGADVAESMSASMPRIYGGKLQPSEFTSLSGFSVSKVMPYLIGTAILGGFGALFFLIAVLSGAGFCAGRYCCGKCGGKGPKDGGYSPNEIRKPLMALGLLSLLSVGSVATLWVYMTSLGNEASSTQSGFLLGDLESTVDRTLSEIVSTNASLVALPADAGPMQAFLQLNLGEMAAIGAESAQLTASLNTMASQIYVNRTFVVPVRPGGVGLVSGATWVCTNCAAVHAQLLSTEATVVSYSSAIAPTVSALNKVLSNIQLGRSKLQNVTDSVSSELTSVYNTLTNDRANADDKRHQFFGQYDAEREGVTIAVMCLPLLAFVGIVAGAWLKKGWPLCGAAITAWLALALFSLAFMVFLPTASVVSDGCVVLNHAELDLANITSSEIDGAVNDCLVNSSLAEPDALNFTGQVLAWQQQYGADTDMTQHIVALNLASLTASVTAAQTSLSSLSLLGSFGLNDSAIDQNIALLNGVVAQYLVPPVTYSRATVASVDDSTPGASPTQHNQALQYKYTALLLMDSELVVGGFLAQVAQNATVASSVYTTLATTVLTVQQLLLEVPVLVLKLFQGLSNVLVQLFWCGWLGDAYRAIKHDVCDGLALDLGIIAMSLFVSIVLLTPVIVLAIIASKRVPNPTPTEPAADPIAALFPQSFKYDEFGNVAGIAPPTTSTQLNTELAALR
jgi:hypothetical protein